ncbi:S41 family peptidase [Streptomyces sp. NPDC048636]|uniref:S41 family peptidase n=1 Tax=Streptomyces sp. NPDC048636 TaxID=3155762 RepID=UPI00342E05BD
MGNSSARRAREPRNRTTSRGVAAAVLLAVVAGTALAAGPVAAAPPTAEGVDGMDGVWRTDGYGTVLAIRDGRLREYQTTGVSCLPGGAARRTGHGGDGSVIYTGGDATVYRIRPEADGTGANLHFDGSVGDRALRRLPALPDRCAKATSTGALRTFDVFWQTFEENYPFFAAKGIDWRAVRDRYRPKVHDGMPDAELFALLREMVRPLYDAHVNIDAGETGDFAQSRPGTVAPGPGLDGRAQRFVERTDLGGKRLRSFANGRIGYARLPDGIGYLRISGFGGYDGDSPTYDRNSAVLDQTLTQVIKPGLRGLVLDLRINGGGSDALALRIAERLTDRPYFAYAKRARNHPGDPSRFTRPQRWDVQPTPHRSRYTGPLAVLTGGETYSAGETLTQALMQRPAKTTRIGRNTQGVFSDVMERALPNGWHFGLPNEEYLTPSGTTFDGEGIPPGIRTGDFLREIEAGTHDSAFARAVAKLRRQSR